MAQQKSNTHAITVEVKWNRMTVHEGKKKTSRMVWYGPGIEVYVIGTLKGGLFAQAFNLAANYAENMHIAPGSMRTVTRARSNEYEKPSLTNSEGLSLKKRLF